MSRGLLFVQMKNLLYSINDRPTCLAKVRYLLPKLFLIFERSTAGFCALSFPVFKKLRIGPLKNISEMIGTLAAGIIWAMPYKC